MRDSRGSYRGMERDLHCTIPRWPCGSLPRRHPELGRQRRWRRATPWPAFAPVSSRRSNERSVAAPPIRSTWSTCTTRPRVSTGRGARGRRLPRHRSRAQAPRDARLPRPDSPLSLRPLQRPGCSRAPRPPQAAVDGYEDFRVDPADTDDGHALLIVRSRRRFQLYGILAVAASHWVLMRSRPTRATRRSLMSPAPASRCTCTAGSRETSKPCPGFVASSRLAPRSSHSRSRSQPDALTMLSARGCVARSRSGGRRAGHVAPSVRARFSGLVSDPCCLVQTPARTQRRGPGRFRRRFLDGEGPAAVSRVFIEPQRRRSHRAPCMSPRWKQVLKDAQDFGLSPSTVSVLGPSS